MRILKFIGAFVITALLLFLIVFGFNIDALYILHNNQRDMQEGQEWVIRTSSLERLTQYIGAQPERVSIASIAINNPDSSIMYNEHSPRTMGRLANIFLLAAYMQGIDKGTITADKRVPMKDVNAFQLPYMGASDHDAALSFLKDNHKISEAGTVALSDLFQAAAEFKDIAISDYLYFTIGTDRLLAVMDQLNVEDTELPLPFSGLYITINPQLYGREFDKHIDSLSSISRDAFDSLAINNARRFIEDPAFHKKVLTQFEDDKGLGIRFTQQRDALSLFPKTTAYEMAGLMQRLYQEKLISKKASRQMKNILSWPLQNSSISSDFDRYGAMYDSRMGMVNGIDYGVSSYSDDAFAQAVFFDDLQIAFWFHMSSNLMQQDYIQRLIWDPALREATEKEIAKKSVPLQQLN